MLLFGSIVYIMHSFFLPCVIQYYSSEASTEYHAPAAVSLSCRLRFRKWYKQLLLSRKRHFEPVPELDVELPKTEVTLVANDPTNRIRFRSFVQQSISALSPLNVKPALDQEVELMGLTTNYRDYTEQSSQPDSASPSSSSNTNL